MRQPFCLKLRGQYWYYRLNAESGLVEQDEEVWHATGCTDRDSAEWYATRGVEASLPEIAPYLHASGKVLNVGCGPGSTTIDVANRVRGGEVHEIGVSSNGRMFTSHC